MRLAVVSDEPGVRSLATAAGVPAHATVDAAEAALAKEPRPAAVAGTAPAAAAATAAAVIPRAEPSPTPAANLPTDDTKTQVLPAVGLPPAAAEAGSRPPRAGGRLSVEPPLYDVGDASNRRRRSTARFVAPVIALVLLLTLVGLGLYGAYLFVPTATVSLATQAHRCGPVVDDRDR